MFQVAKVMKTEFNRRVMKMLDLNKNIMDTEGAIIFDDVYLYYQERSDEYAIDYTIIDKELSEVIDGGLCCYGDYNENTEMYDSYNGTDKFTLKELFDFINEDKRFHFDKNGIQIMSDDLVEMISLID